MKKQISIWTAGILLIAAVLVTVGIESYKNAGFIATISHAQNTTGTIVSVSMTTGQETTVGIDLNDDGKADVTAYTNSFLGGDIMRQCSQWSDGKVEKHEGYSLTTVNPLTPLKAKIVRCVSANGTFWERTIPTYLLFRYGKDQSDLASN
jgi:hypothetical protein